MSAIESCPAPDGSVPTDSRKGLAIKWLKEMNVLTEVLCGITVALALVPEAIAFAIVAGLKPAVGLKSAWIIAILTAIFGGRPGMISGATGALAVVVGPMVMEHGQEHLFYAVILMGIIQFLLGVLRAGSLIKLIPASVMLGFCNGLALVIGLAQFSTFKVEEGNSRRLIEIGGSWSAFTDGVAFISGREALYAGILTAFAFLVSYGLPKLTKRVPSALAAIVLCTALEWGVFRQVAGRQGTKTVGGVESVGGSFPAPFWFDQEYEGLPLNGKTFVTVLPLAVTLCAIGLLESLMTLSLIDSMTKTKGNLHRECLGQGFANIICGAFGGMGGCAMLGQSMININAGARGRLSSLTSGVFLLLVVLVAAPLIDLIPVSSLAGVMFCVVVHTFEWHSLKLILVTATPHQIRDRLYSENMKTHKIRRTDACVIVLVTIVTLLTDLAIAVAIGLAVSCFMFAYSSSDRMDVKTMEERGENGKIVKIYVVRGILFFGSTTQFLTNFDPENDPEDTVLVFDSDFVTDYSAVDALTTLGDRYREYGKHIKLHQRDVSSQDGVLSPEALLQDGPSMKGSLVLNDKEAHSYFPPNFSKFVDSPTEVSESGGSFVVNANKSPTF